MDRFFVFQCVHDIIIAIKGISFHKENSQGSPHGAVYNYFLTTNELTSFTLVKASDSLIIAKSVDLALSHQWHPKELRLCFSTIQEKCSRS